MGLFKNSKKVLVSTINNNNYIDGDADYIHTGFSYSAIYIYNFLNYGILLKILICLYFKNYFALNLLKN